MSSTCKFKPGDRVRCVESRAGILAVVEAGRVYVVKLVDHAARTIYIEETKSWWYQDRFVPAEAETLRPPAPAPAEAWKAWRDVLPARERECPICRAPLPCAYH